MFTFGLPGSALQPVVVVQDGRRRVRRHTSNGPAGVQAGGNGLPPDRRARVGLGGEMTGQPLAQSQPHGRAMDRRLGSEARMRRLLLASAVDNQQSIVGSSAGAVSPDRQGHNGGAVAGHVHRPLRVLDARAAWIDGLQARAGAAAGGSAPQGPQPVARATPPLPGTAAGGLGDGGMWRPQSASQFPMHNRLSELENMIMNSPAGHALRDPEGQANAFELLVVAQRCLRALHHGMRTIDDSEFQVSERLLPELGSEAALRHFAPQDLRLFRGQTFRIIDDTDDCFLVVPSDLAEAVIGNFCMVCD